MASNLRASILLPTDAIVSRERQMPFASIEQACLIREVPLISEVMIAQAATTVDDATRVRAREATERASERQKEMTFPFPLASACSNLVSCSAQHPARSGDSRYG